MVDFLMYKERVMRFFDDCILFANQNGFQTYVDVMKANRDKIAQNCITILTCGEMRRGKSSLLCALLEEEDLFPVDIAVTTCIVTLVSYGETERITVILEDGKEKEITRTQIKDYVTEQKNQYNHKRAKLVKIETPNPKLENGLRFVDTPGVGSLNPEHSQITYEFLPQADVVLFVGDATAPLTNPELTFLKYIKRYCNNLLFLLTKKDMQADYESIIKENKEKIATFTEIPEEKINYIPVSSTMKLAYLTNGNQRMLRNSNFEQLEATIWDKIQKNRAEIMIMPPLAELVKLLKSIEKEIHIKLTAYNGSNKEREEMKNKLNSLQKDRQGLLEKGAGWQSDIQRELDNINFDINAMIMNYQTEATDVLEDGLRNNSYIKNPSQLLNQIILLTLNRSNDISEKVFDKLCQLKFDFEDRTRISLYDNIVKAEIRVEEDPKIVFEKPKTLDRVISGGRKVTMSSMGLSTAGAIFGGLGGAVIGFFIGGPAGAAALAIQGAGYGGALGGAGGLVKGTVAAVKDPGVEDVPKIRMNINKYITQNVNEWKLNMPKYIKDISYEFVKSLKASVEANKKVIEKDINSLQEACNLDKEKQIQESKRVQALQVHFSRLIVELDKLKEIKSEVKWNESKVQENAKVEDGRTEFDYSTLDE